MQVRVRARHGVHYSEGSSSHSLITSAAGLLGSHGFQKPTQQSFKQTRKEEETGPFGLVDLLAQTSESLTVPVFFGTHDCLCHRRNFTCSGDSVRIMEYCGKDHKFTIARVK